MGNPVDSETMGIPKPIISGIASRRGSKIVPIEEIARRFHKDVEKVNKNCGAKNLYRIDTLESITGLTVEASKDAVSKAGLAIGDISGIYASPSSFGGFHLLPGPARILGASLGLQNIPMLSLSTACAGGMHALQAAYNQLLIDSLRGKRRNYLVVTGDHSSRVLNPALWETSPLFSDGVAALIVTNKDSQGCSIEKIEGTTCPGNIYSMNIRNPFASEEKSWFEMDGIETYRFAVRGAFPVILELLGLAKMPSDAYFIPHQASRRIIDSITSFYELDQSRVYSDGVKDGNTTGASTFIGLEDTLNRQLDCGCNQIILGAFGAELQVAAALLRRVNDKNG